MAEKRLKKRTTVWLCVTALFMAINIVMSMSIFSIPVPGGHLYLNDIIICVASSRESQIGRMMQTRGLARSEAEARIDSQMDVLEKARKSTYAIFNEGSQQQLEEEAARLVAWLERQVKP